MTSDDDLYLRWLEQRDEPAFSALARRHADLVADIAWRFYGDHARAEDAVQEALLALARDGTRAPGEVGVRAWLARFAVCAGRNARVSDAARGRRERAVGESRKEASVGAAEAEIREEVAAALSRLPGEGAALLTLRYLHGMEYADLAVVLEVAEPTARVRVHRALETLRADVRSEDASDDRLARGIAMLPEFRLSPGAADRIVEGALASVRSAPAGAASAKPRPPSAPPASPTRALVRAPRWIFVPIAAVIGGGAFLLWRSQPDAVAPPPSSYEAADAHSAVLRGTPPRAAVPVPPPAPETEEGEAPAAPLFPAPTRAVPSATRPPPQAPGVQTRVHLVLLGSGERLPMKFVNVDGDDQTAVDPPAAEVTVGVRAGHGASVYTEDLRAAVRTINVRVPDPVPADLDVHVPAASDPRFAHPVIRVTDAKTGLALPRAVLEAGRMGPWLSPLAADEEGRIHVTPDVLHWLQYNASMIDTGMVHEPDHFPKSWNGRLRFDGEWAALDTIGEYRVALEPILPGERRLTVRLLDAAGSPERGALLLFRSDWVFNAPSLCARTDADGIASSPTYRAFNLEIFVRGSVVASLVLGRDQAREATPEGRIRELRLPALAPVHIVVRDAGPTLHAVARMSSAESIDATAIADAKAKGFDPGKDFYGPGEPIPVPPVAGDPADFDLLAPVDREVEITFRRSDPKDWVRTLKIRASSAAPLRIERAWADLENPVGK